MNCIHNRFPAFHLLFCPNPRYLWVPSKYEKQDQRSIVTLSSPLGLSHQSSGVGYVNSISPLISFFFFFMIFLFLEILRGYCHFINSYCCHWSISKYWLWLFPWMRETKEKKLIHDFTGILRIIWSPKLTNNIKLLMEMLALARREIDKLYKNIFLVYKITLNVAYISVVAE